MSYPPDPVHLRGKQTPGRNRIGEERPLSEGEPGGIRPDEGCDTNPITDWRFEEDKKPIGWWFTRQIDPHSLCCEDCKKNRIRLDEIANLAHGYKSLNGTLGAVGSTLLSILDKER